MDYGGNIITHQMNVRYGYRLQPCNFFLEKVMVETFKDYKSKIQSFICLILISGNAPIQ